MQKALPERGDVNLGQVIVVVQVVANEAGWQGYVEHPFAVALRLRVNVNHREAVAPRRRATLQLQLAKRVVDSALIDEHGKDFGARYCRRRQEARQQNKDE